MLTITYAAMRKAKLPLAMPDATGKLTRAELHKPIPVSVLLDLHGVEAAIKILWCDEANKQMLVQIAADFAEAVLPVWEREYPDDKRPRLAIEAARTGVGAHAAAYDAVNAAHASVNAAACAAAYDAARAAAYAAYASAHASAHASVYDAANAAARAANAGLAEGTMRDIMHKRLEKSC